MSFSEFAYTTLLKPRPVRAMANAFLRAIVPETLRVGPATIVLNPRDPVVSGALTLGVYEKDEIHYFLDHFKPGMTFVDVGANVGLYTGMAIRLAASNILAVEPHKEAFAYLQKTVAANSPSQPVSLSNVAAGKEPGELTLYSNPENKGDNRLYPDPLLSTKQTVPVMRLGDLCNEQKISKIDFLKMDVQGAEMLVLEGGMDILSKSPACTIMTEFWPEGLQKCGSNPHAYLAAFTDLGFEIRELRKGKLHPTSPKVLIESTLGRQYRNLLAFGPKSGAFQG
jgi:FkbM family methyltransferase